MKVELPIDVRTQACNEHAEGYQKACCKLHANPGRYAERTELR